MAPSRSSPSRADLDVKEARSRTVSTIAIPIAARVGRWIEPWRGGRQGSGFAGNVALMLTGTVAGQAIGVLLSPVLTRVYTPDQFGFLSVYAATLTILSMIAALGFDLAIPLVRSDDELANLLAASAGALLGLTGVLTAAAFSLPDSALARLSLGALAAYRPLLPIGFLCLGGYYVMVAAATRLAAFRDIAATRLSQGLFGPMSQILLGLVGLGSAGLAIGLVVGQSSGTLLLLRRVRALSPGLVRAISWRGVWGAVVRYRRFPLFASWARLLDMAGSGTILFLLVASCWSSEIAGFMFLTERVISRPLLMVSTSLLQVFVGEAGQAVHHDPARLRSRFRQVVGRQFLLAAGWILIANILAGWAFPLLFGAEWAGAVPYLRALSPAYLALAVLHPVSTSLQLLERQVLAAVWQAARLVAVVGGAALSWHLGFSVLTALWIASLAQVVACAAMLALIATAIERMRLAWRT
jgi:O-antigen/teichoic acid export membrane protein